MKTCPRCKESKTYDQYGKNRRKADGLQSYCKACVKQINHAYYLATPERNPQRLASRMRCKAAAREHVWSYLQSHSCVDCGERNPVVLEFDHVRGEKLYAVSDMVSRGMAIRSIDLEIAKCEVRCANCHRIVTAERAGWDRAPVMHC